MSKKPRKTMQPRLGRPPIYQASFPKIAKALCSKLACTDADLAETFGVSISQIKNWKRKHPDFLAATKVGKEPADDRVEHSLFERAVGYSFDAEKIAVDSKTGRTTRVKYVEHIPPDTTAQRLWLINRRGDQWRDKHEIETEAGVTITVKGGLP